MGEGEAGEHARLPALRTAPGKDVLNDHGHMRRALDLAARGAGLVSPNPMVGATVVAEGRVVGEGYHLGPGTPHAEVVALEEAGPRARGATLYTTLEPCSHFGRTPPCVPRVIDSGIARVVSALGDPNPLVNGQGFTALRESGIDVEVGILESEAARHNEAFLKHVTTALPLVTLKMAASLDGKAAARDGSSRWISGPESREEVHRMRAASDAVLVGAGTAFRDDPSLTVRDADLLGGHPLRVMADGRGIVPETHRLFTDGTAPTLVATTEAAPEYRREAWRDRGADVVVLDDAGSGLIPLRDLFRELGKRDVQSVLMEGGPTIAWEAVREGMVDRVVLFFAPILVGGEAAPSLMMGGGMPTIGEAISLRVREVARVGSDIKVVADVHRDR